MQQRLPSVPWLVIKGKKKKSIKIKSGAGHLQEMTQLLLPSIFDIHRPLYLNVQIIIASPTFYSVLQAPTPHQWARCCAVDAPAAPLRFPTEWRLRAEQVPCAPHWLSCCMQLRLVHPETLQNLLAGNFNQLCCSYQHMLAYRRALVCRSPT